MSELLCTRCKAEPRIAGNRWGRECHARYMREVYRPRRAAILRKARAAEVLAIVSRLSREAAGKETV